MVLVLVGSKEHGFVNIEEIARLLEKYWYKKTGLSIAVISAIFIEGPMLGSFNAPAVVVVPTFLVTIAVIIFVWYVTKRPPKTPKDKIGFLISIACENDKESQQVREDFIIPLRQLVKSGEAGKAFHFIEIPEHIAKDIVDIDDATDLRIKCRAHFVLYGRVRLRKIGNEDHHVIDLNGIVAHRPISKGVTELFSREFSELLPRRVNISKENDLLSFQFTSEWTEVVAKYIIGIAAAMSGDISYAQALYSEVKDRLVGKDVNFPVYQKLSERLPIRVSELNEAMAAAAHKAWYETHDPEYLDQLGEYLEKVDPSRVELKRVLNLRAIYILLKEKDGNRAISVLRKAKDTSGAIWYYNMAFLYAYTGDLKKAIRNYRAGIIFRVEPEVISQIEDFICWVLNQEPEKYQLYYCLGFFNWQVKGDTIKAIEDLEIFLRSGTDTEYERERMLAKEWIKEIKDK